MRRTSWIPALVGAIMSGPAVAGGISAAFDGVYMGEATRNPALSSGSCEALTVGKVTITRGNLHSEAVPGVAWIVGVITEDGHVKGSMARPGGPRLSLEGRISGDTISAGFIEPDAMCAWLIQLKRAPG